LKFRAGSGIAGFRVSAIASAFAFRIEGLTFRVGGFGFRD